MSNPSNLTDKQRKFCEEYMVDLNATQAAIRAGYSEKTAREQASQNLSKLNIQNYIHELQKDIRERNKITVDGVVKSIADIATFDIAQCYNEDGSLKPIHDIPIEIRTSISGIKTYEEFIGKGKERERIGDIKELKIINKLDALEKLMRHLGGYEKDNNQRSSQVTLFQLPENGRTG
ncbi:terminase small subunit [Flagellimonas flava]|uniref:terminase small subunit n=1 Tax=Flagellimonas flava TaxID=570519 RepID=UPI003D651D49